MIDLLRHCQKSEDAAEAPLSGIGFGLGVQAVLQPALPRCSADYQMHRRRRMAEA